MLKKEILKLPELKNSEYSNIKLENEEDIFSFIEKLPTIQKIFIVQNLLKEMISIKQLFLDNKQNMIKKIDSNCYKYYKNLLLIKEKLDYCQSKDKEKMINYILLKEEETDDALHNFEEEQKNFISNFFFELRNDNNLMIKIIKEIDIKYYEQLSFFLTHLLYENSFNNCFNQDELILMIYLVMDDTIKNKFPSHFTDKSLFELNQQKNNFFLYYFLKTLITKTEIRIYLINIFHDIILDLENQNKKWSVIITLISDELFKQNNLNNIRKKTTASKLDMSLNVPRNKSNINFSINTQTLLKNNSKEKYFDNNSNKNFNYTELFQFFAENNFTRFTLSKLLSDLNNKARTESEEALMEFLLNIKNEIRQENKEIFSNSIILEILKEIEDINLIELYQVNFLIITSFIENFYKKIIESINSMPYIMKIIFLIFDNLIQKKYEKNPLTNYQNIMLKLNFFFSVYILPILQNPISNGCTYDGVISENTLANLSLLSNIIEKSISGNLFKYYYIDNYELCYTIFNIFIVSQMKTLFDIVKNIDINIKKEKIEVPKFITDIDIKKNINYDYFLYNKEEFIRYQSVCFSYSDLMMFINVLEGYNFKEFLNEMKSKKNQDFYLILKYKKIFDNRNKENISNNKIEYIFVSNIIYKNSFLNDIKAVTEEHFENYFKNHKKSIEIDENILKIKKCLIEVLTYINKINKVYFNSFISNKNILNVIKNSEINIFNKYQKYIRYNNDINSVNNIIDKESNNNFKTDCLSCDLLEDADFLEEIFPKIISSIKYELNNNLSSSKFEHIIFCITYLQINIKNLDENYSKNNYSKLFIEIIKDSLNLIKGLHNNILNHFYLKIREGDKINLILSKYSYEILSLEKYYTIGYLYNKISLDNLNINKNEEKEKSSNILKSEKTLKFLDNMNYLEPKNPSKVKKKFSINKYIEKFEDFTLYKKNIIDKEKEKEIPEKLSKFFKNINLLVKKEKIMNKYTPNEYNSICNELENYILLKLHKKIYPLNPTEGDIFIYQKCSRLNFIKPENIILDKKNKISINEKLLNIAIEYITNIDNKKTPADKIKSFGKAFQILQNSISFSSGKNELGIDDTLPFLIYAMIKAKPKMIYTNYIFCKLYINKELEKNQYGILLTQIGMVIKIIINKRYNELNDVTEEQFGADDDVPPDLLKILDN